MKCPACKEEIEEGAKKCKHCGCYTTIGRRSWAGIRSVLHLGTLIAALVLLYLAWESHRGMQEELQLQRTSVEQLSQQFVEEKRPRIEIRKPGIVNQDTASLLYSEVYNNGFADAEDILIYTLLKYEDSLEDTLAADITRVAKVTKETSLTNALLLPPLQNRDLTCLIEVRYTWVMRELDYKDKKYFLLRYDKEQNGYQARILADRQIRELWK